MPGPEYCTRGRAGRQAPRRDEKKLRNQLPGAVLFSKICQRITPECPASDPLPSCPVRLTSGLVESGRNEPPVCAKEATVSRSLSDRSNDRIDLPGAVSRDRRALARRGRAADPGDRAAAHISLADALERTAIPAAIAESHRYRLAALVYQLEAGLGEPLQMSLAAYAVRFRRAGMAGQPLAIPRLTAVLDDPAMAALDDWLRERGADVAETQTAVDFYLEQARRIGTGEGFGEHEV